MSQIHTYDWISIGGGAAGYFGAINFAVNRKNVKVLILEASPFVLSKVKISGGGRCNVTHHCFEPKDLIKNYPRGSKELLSVFTKFQARDTVDWFRQRNISLKTEDDGRMFPVSDRSQSIIDCFLSEQQRYGIELRSRSSLKEIAKTEGGFRLETEDGRTLVARNILVATGSNQKVWRLLERMGHKIVSPAPSLFSFNISDQRLKNLSGRSFKKVEITAKIGKKCFDSTGPMLITHWGLSGPSILKLSSVLARELQELGYKFSLQINFLADLKSDEILQIFSDHQITNAKKKLKNSGVKAFPTNYWMNLLEVLNINPEKNWADISKSDRSKILEEIRAASFEVSGKTTNKDEFVTAGGLELKEVDFRTMQSRLFPGMFFAGEVLNIDGLTGGFNFQAAWSTSFIAARSAD